MSAVHMVGVSLIGQGGAGMCSPMAYFAERALAEQKSKEAQELLSALQKLGKIVMPAGKFPKVVMTVSDLFANLGIRNFGHAIFSSEMSGAVDVVEPGRIILPGN